MSGYRKSELLCLCCAVCGPLSKDEISSFFSENEQNEAGVKGAYLFRVAEQSDFPWLKSVFDSTQRLQRLCLVIMTRRISGDGYSAIPEHERSIAAARYALLCGDTVQFQRFHRLFCGMRRLGLRPGMEHEEFWNGVLGPSWRGIEYVPSGRALDEIRTMQARRYMLLPLPAKTSVDPSKLPYLLGLGWCLLRADLSMKPKAVEIKTADDAQKSEVAVSRAYWSLWAGSWEHAYLSFNHLFRAKETVRYAVGDEMSEGLLIIACIVAIRSHAPQRVVELWVNAAREIALRMLSDTDATNREDISGFCDALLLWDSVENRKMHYFELPPLRGDLSCLPLAMGALTIMQHTGVHLPLDTLVKATIETHKRGLTLLAHYAASTLILLPELPTKTRGKLLKIIDKCSFKPLYESQGSEMIIGGAQMQWQQLSSLVQGLNAEPQQWLYWDISVDKTGCITRLEPRLVEKPLHAPGKKVELDELADPAVLNCQDKRDLALAELARSLDSVKQRGIPMVADALAGHPRLRLVQGSYRRLIRVQKKLPVIHASVERYALKLEMNSRQFQQLSEESDPNGAASPKLLSIPAFTPRMQVLVDYFAHGPVARDLVHREQLRWVIAKLSEYFHVEGEMPASLLEFETPAAQFVFCAKRVGQGGALELLVEHLPGRSSVLSVPGQGDAVMLLDTPKGPICVRRDREQELAEVQSIISACPQLHKIARDDEYRWQFNNQEDMLQALHELGHTDKTVRWAEPETAFSIVDAPEEGVQVFVLHEHKDWLEIGAELAVNEKEVLKLSTLMDAYRRRSGRFICLAPGRYMHADDELTKQLQQMDDYLRPNRKERNALPVAAVPGFAAQWQGRRSLPEAICHRENELQECSTAAVPPEFKATLRDYQLFGYRWLLARVRAGLGACLADDMGLGKTIQVLALLTERAGEGVSFVVAPLSLMGNWVAEAARFAPTLRVISYAEKKRPADMPKLQAGDVVIASYGQVATHEKYFQGIEWNVIVLDEAQAIKNPSSRRAQAVCSLSASAKICLTGTPVENHLLDLWSIMHFLNPLLLGTRAEFSRRSKGNLEGLRSMVAPLMLRRTKKEVLPQLPPMTELRVMVDFSEEERALYESCRRRALDYAQQGDGAVTLLAELTRLRRLCCHGKLVLNDFHGQSSKLKAMLQLIEELNEAGHRALVFSQFTDVLDLAEIALHDKGFTTLRLDGSMSAAKREKKVQLFQQGNVQVFLISLKAGGVGLNLTAADYVILLDPWWNPAVEDQATSRSHRIGQHNPVTVYRLIARDTVEERVMEMQEAKQSLAESIIHEGTASLETLRNILMQS